MAETEALTALPGPAHVPRLHVIACGLLLTAIKPAYIDGPAYLTYAAEFAAHPLEPYACQYGSPYVAPVNNLLVPPDGLATFEDARMRQFVEGEARDRLNEAKDTP